MRIAGRGGAAGFRVLSTFLYGVDIHDVPTFIAVPLAVALLAMTACLVPLRRAATMDPLVALRQS